jgi:hypothetical protein
MMKCCGPGYASPDPQPKITYNNNYLADIVLRPFFLCYELLLRSLPRFMKASFSAQVIITPTLFQQNLTYNLA